MKKNQKELHHWIAFNTSIKEAAPIDVDISINKEHGRLEERICEVYDDLYQITPEWRSARSVIKVSTRSKNLKTNKQSSEIRYYISSLTPETTTAKQFQNIIRSHWQIENSCHYIKDVSFHEDASTFRTNFAPQNMSILRSIAMNLLRLNGYENLKKARKILGWGFDSVFGLKGIKR